MIKNNFSKKLPHIFKDHINISLDSPNRQYAKFYHSIVIHERGNLYTKLKYIFSKYNQTFHNI